jgi:hypothetical protein
VVFSDRVGFLGDARSFFAISAKGDRAVARDAKTGY